ALSADPVQRPASCREFVEDLIGHSTRRVPTTDSSTALSELWYLIYKDDTGQTHTVKGSISAIRRSLKDGLLGDADHVRASRSREGPFEPLRGYPEFRDIVVSPAPLPVPGGQARPSAARAAGMGGAGGAAGEGGGGGEGGTAQGPDAGVPAGRRGRSAHPAARRRRRGQPPVAVAVPRGGRTGHRRRRVLLHAAAAVTGGRGTGPALAHT